MGGVTPLRSIEYNINICLLWFSCILIGLGQYSKYIVIAQVNKNMDDYFNSIGKLAPLGANFPTKGLVSY